MRSSGSDLSSVGERLEPGSTDDRNARGCKAFYEQQHTSEKWNAGYEEARSYVVKLMGTEYKLQPLYLLIPSDVHLELTHSNQVRNSVAT
jgi:hypothetical protein